MAQLHDSGILKKRSGFMKMILVILFCAGYSTGVFAQQSNTVTDSKKMVTVQDYISNNPGTVLTNYYTHDPSDRLARRAIRYAIIMDSPEFSNNETAYKESIQMNLNNCMISIDAINKMTTKGISLKRAKEKFYILQSEAAKSGSNVKPGVSVTAVNAD